MEVLQDGLSELVITRESFVQMIVEGCKFIKKGPPYEP